MKTSLLKPNSNEKTFLIGILILLVFAIWAYQNQAAERSVPLKF